MSDSIPFPPGGRQAQTMRPPPISPRIAASPFIWRDPRTLPRRQWLYGTTCIRRFVSLLVAPGEVGKTSLLIAEALALCTGRALLGIRPRQRCRVWLVNLEDPAEELERRVLAAMIHYGMTPAEVEGWLFLDSGRDMQMLLTMNKDGAVAIDPIASEAIIGTMQENQIDVLVLDPFVSLHSAQENDNRAIDMVTKELGRIAELTNAAIMLAHHSRKILEGEVRVDDARGASALLAAARVARVLNKMPKADAERWEIENPRLYFRADNGKSNLAPPADKADWYHLVNVRLGNGEPVDGNNPFDINRDEGDSVGVVTLWEPPAEAEIVHTTAQTLACQRAVSEGGPWQLSDQATKWVGVPIAKALDVDPNKAPIRKQIKKWIQIWVDNDVFKVVDRVTTGRKERPCVEVKEWVTSV